MPRSTTRAGALTAFALLVLAMPLVAEAQVVERPPRSTGGLFGGGRPPDPNRTRSELTLSLVAMGGWDDNLAPEGTTVSIDPSAPRVSGYTGFGSAAMRFWRGRANRSVTASGRGFLNSYSNLVDPLPGGDLDVSAAFIGQRTDLTVGGAVQYRPTFILGAFAPIATEVDSGVVADADPTRGVTQIRSLSRGARLTLGHGWNARQRTTIGYDVSAHISLSGPAFESDVRSGSLTHDWNFSRPAGVNLAYHRSTHQSELASGERPLESQTAELGVELRKAISATRRLMFRAGGGAMHVRTTTAVDNSPLEHVSPSAFGSARMDLGRTWSVSSDYRRAATVLEGVALQSFVTDAGSLTVGGSIGRRLLATVSGAYSTGQGRGSDVGSYESVNGVLQVQSSLARCCSLVTSYSYYAHRLRDVAAVPAGFPRRFERNSVRLGVSISLPLYGTFQAN